MMLHNTGGSDSPVTVARHLVRRLASLGVRHFFGVPGHYNFDIVSAVQETPGCQWIGCCNELNAGYAADGYARINGLASLVTTFGVGELSAMNAVAGSFCEHVPVIAITGAPSSGTQASGAFTVHSMGDGNFTRYAEAFKQVTAAQAFLTAENAMHEIERVIQVALIEKRPVYISVPEDVAQTELVPYGEPFQLPCSDAEVLHACVQAILSRLDEAMRPAIISDAGVVWHHAEQELNALVARSGLPVASTINGKAGVDESLSSYLGMYWGSLINPQVQEVVEGADLLLWVGPRPTTTNLGMGTSKVNRCKTIEILDDHVVIDGGRVTYNQVFMKDILCALANAMSPMRRADVTTHLYVPVLSTDTRISNSHPDAPLTMDTFAKRAEGFLRENDIVVGDIGSSWFAALSMRLPSGCSMIHQPLYASIGYCLPAALGAALASSDGDAKTKHRRVILFIGDGALQMTAQEISTILRCEGRITCFVLNNSGYTMERMLWRDPLDRMNDLGDWRYTELPRAFGAGTDVFTARAHTAGELDTAMACCEKAASPFSLVELVLDKLDAPLMLRRVHDQVSKQPHGMHQKSSAE